MANGWLSVTCSDVLKGCERLPYFLAVTPKSSKKGFLEDSFRTKIILFPPTPSNRYGCIQPEDDLSGPLHVKESGSAAVPLISIRLRRAEGFPWLLWERFFLFFFGVLYDRHLHCLVVLSFRFQTGCVACVSLR